MKKYRKLIFIDSSNTTRSIMAELILKQKDFATSIEIESRGLVVLFPAPVNQKAEAILISNGIQPQEYMSKPLTQADIGDGEGVLLLVMEKSQSEKILQEYANIKNLHVLTEFVQQKGDVGPLYGQPLIEYGQCYETLDRLLNQLIIKLKEEEIRE